MSEYVRNRELDEPNALVERIAQAVHAHILATEPQTTGAGIVAVIRGFIRAGALQTDENPTGALGSSPSPSEDAPDAAAELGPCCGDVRCSWQPIPHVHEGREVYPAPPDRIEWTAALAADENVPHD